MIVSGEKFSYLELIILNMDLSYVGVIMHVSIFLCQEIILTAEEVCIISCNNSGHSLSVFESKMENM